MSMYKWSHKTSNRKWKSDNQIEKGRRKREPRSRQKFAGDLSLRYTELYLFAFKTLLLGQGEMDFRAMSSSCLPGSRYSMLAQREIARTTDTNLGNREKPIDRRCITDQIRGSRGDSSCFIHWRCAQITYSQC